LRSRRLLSQLSYIPYSAFIKLLKQKAAKTEQTPHMSQLPVANDCTAKNALIPAQKRLNHLLPKIFIYFSLKMVEAAGVEPASKVLQNSSHPQVCLIYSQISKVATKFPFPM
jgi:hypothetical protein